MLRSGLLHPQILAALAGAGHGSLVLIADANYPASTTRGPNAEVVHLNLVPGTVDALTVLTAVAAAIPVEEAVVMSPLSEGPYHLPGDPPIWSQFVEVLAAAGSPVPLVRYERAQFYAAAGTSEVALVVVSAETQIYANILLRIGVVQGAEA
jgi:L-fucose mutarotase